jgi:hypothetical protein
MIPMLLRIRIVRETGTSLRLWVPLFILWIIVLPFALLALPIICIVLWAKKVKAFRTIAAFWQLFASTRGTHIETADGHDSVLVRFY